MQAKFDQEVLQAAACEVRPLAEERQRRAEARERQCERTALPRLDRGISLMAQARPAPAWQEQKKEPQAFLARLPPPAPALGDEPMRPGQFETFDQTRARLYREHKARGTLAVFWTLYPTG